MTRSPTRSRPARRGSIEQISLIQPRVIVTLGNFATRFVLNTQTGITRLRGQVHDWHGRTVIPTFHPAAILHGGGERSRQFELLRDDLRLVRRTLDEFEVPEAAPVVEMPEVTGVGAAETPSAAGDPPPADADQLELF